MSSSTSKNISVCPYCHTYLEKIPTRKKKCPECGKPIYIKYRPNDRTKRLVTEEQSKEIEEEWQDYLFVKEVTEEFGITKQELDRERGDLAKQFGQQPNSNDLKWRLYNRAIEKEKDMQKLKSIYYSMALFVQEEGRDPLPLLLKSHRCDLSEMKKNGITKVKVRTSGEQSCAECRKLKGQVFSIEEALDTMPLPCKRCMMWLDQEKYSFCRCFYQ